MNVISPRQSTHPSSTPHTLSSETVSPESRCPFCGESRRAKLRWLDMERVRCQTCGRVLHLCVNRSD